MINIENPIKEVKAIAAEYGVCCTNCQHCAQDEDFYGMINCILHIGMSIEVDETHFCADFEPKPEPEK